MCCFDFYWCKYPGFSNFWKDIDANIQDSTSILMHTHDITT